MSLPLYVGVGTGVGALIGGAAGYVLKMKKPANVVTKKTVTPVPVKITPSKTKPMVTELFGAQVLYLTSASEFYTMLVRFENYLQFATERDSFKAAVENIDNLLGLENLLHGRDPIAKAALPNLAEIARRKILQILKDIIEFSDEQRASPTKKEGMNVIKEEINENMLSIVKDMNRALAAMPVIVTKK